MKKIITALLIAAMLAFGVGCGNNANTSESGRQVLRVAMECAYEPYNWTQFDNSNNAVAIKGHNGEYANGYDVMIAKKIADALDMDLEVYAFEWGSLIAGLQAGTFDLIIAGMSPTAERKEVIDFSDAYLESDIVVVVRKDGAYASAASVNDLDGATLVAQMETFHEEVISQVPNSTQYTSMEDFPTMITALKAGTVDGYIAERPGATADCAGNSDFVMIDLKNNENGFVIDDMSNVQLAVGIKKGSDLLAKVNAALAGISEEERLNLMLSAIELANN